MDDQHKGDHAVSKDDMPDPLEDGEVPVPVSKEAEAEELKADKLIEKQEFRVAGLRKSVTWVVAGYRFAWQAQGIVQGSGPLMSPWISGRECGAEVSQNTVAG